MRFPVETGIWLVTLVGVIVTFSRWWRYSKTSMDYELPEPLLEATRRLRARWQRRMWAAIGCWQIMTGVFVTRVQGNGWESGVALWMCGGFFLVLAVEPWRWLLERHHG